MTLKRSAAGVLACSIIAVCLASTGAAQPPSQPATPPAGQRPGFPALQSFRPPEGARVLRDRVYAKAPGAAGEVELKLDLFLPPPGPASLTNNGQGVPLVIWIHGGGWRSGNQRRTPALFLLEQGFAVASITYRLTPQATWPAQIHDCQAALRWLRATSGEHGIDPARVGVWGASAGGHLAALVGLAADVPALAGDIGDHDEQPLGVRAVVDWFGPSDFTGLIPAGAAQNDAADDRGAEDFGDPEADADQKPASPPPEDGAGRDRGATAGGIAMIRQLIGAGPRENPEAYRQASPVTHVSAGDPPFLIMHGERDRLVNPRQSRVLHEALQRAGVPSELVMLEGAGHGDSPKFFDAEARTKIIAFFNQHVRGPVNAPPANAPAAPAGPAPK